ncbi:MAG: hypothetical protein CR982_09810 [Candidatus Cloacimonadota bacterium]|nr:MAG: hypothetical protein CR982_09810 [Candidatus Cloacimonadota bacterium]PIE78201.1 MAG: hypothetical protein CSA15_09125 [Candidatus Delongbacteria bacterium]
MKYLIFIFTFTMLIFSNPIRSKVDIISKREYNNFKTDSTDVKFIQNKNDKWLLFSEPNKNSEVIFYLEKLTFCELVGVKDPFYKVRVFDKRRGYIEGWSKKSGFLNEIYYGAPLVGNEEKKEIKKESPLWVVKEATLYSDSLLTKPIDKLNIGDALYSKDRGKNYYKIVSDNGLSKGFIKIKDCSPFMILKDGSRDFSKVSNYSISLIENDIDIDGFVSYSVMELVNGARSTYIEDKRCFAKNDSLYYRYTYDNNRRSVLKDFKIKGREMNPFIMCKVYDDQIIKTSRDSLPCKVIEFLYKPKAGKLITNNIEINNITNKLIRVYIYNNPDKDYSVIVQKEEKIFIWNYEFDLKNSRYLKNSSKEIQKFKRLITFKEK